MCVGEFMCACPRKQQSSNCNVVLAKYLTSSTTVGADN